MADLSFSQSHDPQIIRLERRAAAVGTALDQLVDAGVISADEGLTAAVDYAAARKGDSARARDLQQQHQGAYKAALSRGDLETAIAEHTAMSSAGDVALATARPDHVNASVIPLANATMTAAQRALPAIRKEFNSAGKAFTAAFEALGGRRFTLAGVLRDGKAEHWQAMVSAAARLDRAAAVLDGLQEIETSGEADIAQRVTLTAHGLAEANALKAAEQGATWLHGEDFAPVRRWLAVLVAAPRAGFTRPRIMAGDHSAAEAVQLTEATQWLVRHGGATNYADRLAKLNNHYWPEVENAA